jgi:hypothetical protein
MHTGYACVNAPFGARLGRTLPGMCANCLSQSEVLVANVAVTAALLKGPTHRVLADLGLVAPPDPVARDVHTVAFLRAIDLDPVPVLGADAVAGADARVADEAAGRVVAPQRVPSVWPWARRSASPIGSQSFAAAQ